MQPTTRTRRLLVAAATAVILSSSLVACSARGDAQIGELVLQDATKSRFYEAPDPLPAGAPGELIRTAALPGAGAGMQAWRIMYHSRGLNDTDIAVSGVVVAPVGPPPPGGRPVVSWAHPTTGAARTCAPSYGIDPFFLMVDLARLIGLGYVVVATDYPGMGVAGPSSYLIGDVEGRSVLDAVRAARNLDAAGAGDETLLWGHSQGGQAALFAAQLAPSYAPDLNLLGVAAAAPAAELGDLVHDHENDDMGVTIGAYVLDAYRHAYADGGKALSLSTVVDPSAIPAVDELAGLCLLSDSKRIEKLKKPLVGHLFDADVETTAPWSSLLARNTPGASPIGKPILIVQGGADTLVLPSSTEKYVAGLCAAGEHVDLRIYPGVTHGLIAAEASADVTQWFEDLVAHRPVPNTCPNT